MKIIRNIEFNTNSKDEKLPYDNSAFPYIASQVELDLFPQSFVPWHWHKAIELFYIDSGQITYHTPHNHHVFSAGSAGMINANVLHKTEFQPCPEGNIQFIHLFEPILLAGTYGSLIDQKYVSPVILDSSIEMIDLSPTEPGDIQVIHLIKEAFLLSEKEFGYEIKVREALSAIWLQLFQQKMSDLKEKTKDVDAVSDKVKGMMIYIHNHYAEKISVKEVAASAFLSERECYRVFQNYLHMTPVDYIRNYRIHIAGQMLMGTQMTITEIGHACGMGNSSYFGKVFREHTGETPARYRWKWQDKNMI